MNNAQVLLLDFMGVCATTRIATSFDDTKLDYVLEVNKQVISQVLRLKHDGWRTALVSNNDRASFTKAHGDIRLDDWFDVVVFSSDAGVQKPNAAIFNFALEALNATASQAVFLDDLARNVDAACALGIDGRWVDNPEQAVDVLSRLPTSD